MAKKVGTLIKEARIGADLTQEQLARKISGLSASDISMAERGKKDLTQTQLKQIAKITGVTQSSLINAAKGTSSTKTASTAKKTSASKKTSSAKTVSSQTSIKVTTAEKKLVELYRAASADDRKAALKVLRGEETTAEDIIENLLESVQDMLGGK